MGEGREERRFSDGGEEERTKKTFSIYEKKCGPARRGLFSESAPR